MKKSFILYHDQYAIIKKLSKEQKGELLELMFLSNIGEELPECDPIVDMAFTVFKLTFDRDGVKWEARSNRNKENGKKGGRPKGNKNEELPDNPEEPKKPSGLSGLQEEPRKAVSVSLSSSVSDSSSVSEEKEHTPSGENVYKKPPKKKKEYSPQFESFWKAYPSRKGTKNGKPAAFKSWIKVVANESFGYDHLEDRILFLKESYGDFPPDASVWLNNKRWEDEYTPPVELDSRGLPAEPIIIFHDVVAQVKREADERRAKENGLS